MLVFAGAGAAALVMLIALAVWRPWTPEPPRLNDEPYKLAQFVATPAFERLPFERQYTYMELLDKKKDDIRHAYAERKLTDNEFRQALQAAYFGDRLGKAKKYFQKPVGAQRTAYLDARIKKKQREKEQDAEDDDDESTGPAKPTEIKRDDSRQEEQMAKWPAEVRAQWDEYRRAYSERKAYFKERAASTPAPVAKPLSAPKPTATKPK